MDGPIISRLYYNTRDVCDLFNIAPHQLRSWEKRFAFLRPVRRSSGRRLYKPQDLEMVEKIKKLKDEGYADDDIREMMRSEEETGEPDGRESKIAGGPVISLLLEIEKELQSILRILTG